MTTPRRPFDYAAFRARYRSALITHGLNPRTGLPAEVETVYRVDEAGRRTLARIPVLPDAEPERLCDPSDPMWWAKADLWAEIGPNHSSVEAAALSSIARQARAISGVPEPQTVDQAVREAWEADGADRMVQIPLPLRDIHKARGVEVVTLNGLRIEVPIKVA